MSAPCLATPAEAIAPVCAPDEFSQGRERTEALVESRQRSEPLDFLLRCWSGMRKLLKTRQASRRTLRVCETAPLGDKRFVAVIQVDQERFLIGGAANSIALLARLSEPAFPSLDMKELSQRSQELQ